MPWYVTKSKQCPASKPYAVINKDSGKVMGCHENKQAAGKQLAALKINVKE